MSYVRKTVDEYQVLTFYSESYQWEISTTEESRIEALKRLKEYRDNMPQYAHKLVKRRVNLNKGEK
jgi:hypothetical protein